MSDIRWYSLTPIDSWFFRDSRPSNAGENQMDLQSLFPPHPQTVVGGIRAALARTLGWTSGNWKQDIVDKLGDGFDDVSPLDFTPPLLAWQTDGEKQTLLFPVPRHLLGFKQPTGDPNEPLMFEPQAFLYPSTRRFLTDAGEVCLPEFPEVYDEDKKRPTTADDFFVTTTGLQTILDGNLPSRDQFLHRSCLFEFEDRVGIDRDSDKRSMYSPGHVRLKEGVSLVVGLGGLDDELKLPCVFPLGGESRLAACVRLAMEPKIPESREGDVLLLVSPATFASAIDVGGTGSATGELRTWYAAGPSDDATRLNAAFEGNVQTCVLDRPLKIGGYDSRNNLSQTLVPYVASGAVWWLQQSLAPDHQGSFKKLGLRTSLGYGAALIGKRALS